VSGDARGPIYIYLCHGPSPALARELRYSLETLMPEIGGDSSRVAVFTDRPADFRDLGVEIIDIADDLAEIQGDYGYRHRAKPVVLARALSRFQRDCAMLDTDSFIRPGFDAATRAALSAGAAMNQFVRRDPYPDFGPFETVLPRLGRYALDRQASVMLNSGLVAARLEHLPLIEDAVVLIERLWKGGLRRHDIEQFAVAEAFRRGGVEVRLIDREFEHYCQRWSRRYMRRRLRARTAGQRIAYGKMRARGFKWGWLARLGWRRLAAAIGDRGHRDAKLS
jgi:hypothetical protein